MKVGPRVIDRIRAREVRAEARRQLLLETEEMEATAGRLVSYTPFVPPRLGFWARTVRAVRYWLAL